MKNFDEVKLSDTKTQLYCVKKFDTPAGVIENSFACGQNRFTEMDAWNVKKQKKEFTRRELRSILS